MLILGLANSVHAERNCCRDAVYNITINLAQTCNDRNIEGQGIARTNCMTTMLTPTSAQGLSLESVVEIEIYELDQNNNLIAREVLEGPFSDGRVIQYQSIVGRRDATPPNGLLVALTAGTSAGNRIVNLWGLTFENSCILPSLPDDSKIGWAGVVSGHRCFANFVLHPLAKNQQELTFPGFAENHLQRFRRHRNRKFTTEANSLVPRQSLA